MCAEEVRATDNVCAASSWNPDSVPEVPTMVRAAQLRNLLEASLKVRGMCVR